MCDSSLRATRIGVGGFLLHGVADNILSAARMAEFTDFLSAHGFAPAALWAVVSVYAQLVCGLCLVTGLAVRAAGFVVAVNFVVAIVMVDGAGGVRSAFPSLALVLIGFQLLAFGPGRFRLDALAGRPGKRNPV